MLSPNKRRLGADMNSFDLLEDPAEQCRTWILAKAKCNDRFSRLNQTHGAQAGTGGRTKSSCHLYFGR